MSLIHDIALTFSPHWSPSIAREVAHRVHDRSHLFIASAEALEEWFPKHIQWRKSFLSWRTIQAPETYKKEIEENGVTCIARNDTRYPPLLKEIHDPPLVLFLKGKICPGITWCAIVGAREASAYGKEQAWKFGKAVALQQRGVISGLAYGIDEHAIRGAHAAGGNILVVLAGGHLALNSREQEIAKRILEGNGGIISERPPAFHPQKYHFPIRNRLIAGIAERTLIVEAKKKSGSLITGYQALKENREVFAIPGPITSPVSEGCHALIKEGAGLCTSIHDFLEIPIPQTPPPTPSTPTPPSPPPPLSPLQQKLWNLLQQPRSFDSLVEYAQEKASEVAGILNIWEIEGYLALKNGRYTLVPYEHSSHC